MKKKFCAFALVACMLLLSACAASHTYVDPQYHQATYNTVFRLSEPVPVRLDVKFLQNWKPLPIMDAELLSQVERTLRESSVFKPTTDTNAPVKISVTAHKIKDASSRRKGFVTGLTFGISGSMKDDHYEFTFTYQDAANRKEKAVYPHAIHTATGDIANPSGLYPMKPDEAFGCVVEDTVLNFIKYLQDKGLITRYGLNVKKD